MSVFTSHEIIQYLKFLFSSTSSDLLELSARGNCASEYDHFTDSFSVLCEEAYHVLVQGCANYCPPAACRSIYAAHNVFLWLHYYYYYMHLITLRKS